MSIGGGMRRFTLVANGARDILRVQTAVTTELELKFGVAAATFQPDLTARTFTEALGQEFEDNGVEISDDPEVTIFEVDERWIITDDDNIHTYLVSRAGATLNINLELDISPPHPAARAHTPATNLTHFGEEVPARAPSRPLGENVPVAAPEE